MPCFYGPSCYFCPRGLTLTRHGSVENEISGSWNWASVVQDAAISVTTFDIDSNQTIWWPVWRLLFWVSSYCWSVTFNLADLWRCRPGLCRGNFIKVIVGKVRKSGVVVCRGDQSGSSKSRECYPLGRFNLKEGEAIKFTDRRAAGDPGVYCLVNMRFLVIHLRRDSSNQIRCKLYLASLLTKTPNAYIRCIEISL